MLLTVYQQYKIPIIGIKPIKINNFHQSKNWIKNESVL